MKVVSLSGGPAVTVGSDPWIPTRIAVDGADIAYATTAHALDSRELTTIHIDVIHVS